MHEIKRNQIIDPIFSNDSKLDENIAAAFIQVKHKINDKIGFQAGLRYEHTKTIVQGVEGKEVFVNRNYGNFFPTLFLSYKINDFNNINLAASQRINRPALNNLAPFIYFLDINQVFQGNVALQPSFTDNLQFDYRFKAFNLSIQYSTVKKVISRFQPYIDPTPPQATTAVSYEKDIAPIFQRVCTDCHNAEDYEGDLDLTSKEGILCLDREAEDRLLITGRPDDSHLLTVCEFPLDDEDHMPPEDEPQMTSKEVATLRRWIQEGCKFD